MIADLLYAILAFMRQIRSLFGHLVDRVIVVLDWRWHRDFTELLHRQGAIPAANRETRQPLLCKRRTQRRRKNRPPFRTARPEDEYPLAWYARSRVRRGKGGAAVATNPSRQHIPRREHM